MVASTSAVTAAPISFSGLASGVDTDSIVQKILAVDQQPITDLQNAETGATNKLKAFGAFNTLLKTLQTSAGAMNLQSEVRTTTANVSSGGPFTATSNNAFTGTYNISVSQLAQVQKDISTGFASNSGSVLGTGTVTINGQVITLDSTNNSLQNLMSAINQISGTTGVTASIINDGTSGTNSTPYHLVLTGKDASTSFTVSSALQDSNGNAISLGDTTVQTAQQAKLKIDGVDVVSNSNTVSGAISGVTLNLNAISAVSNPGPPAQYATSQLNIVPDTTTLEKNITAFVTSYNAIMNWISSGYVQAASVSHATSSTTSTNPLTATAPTDAQLSQILMGDPTINGIKRQLQTMLSGTANTSSGSGALNNMSELGISTNEDGSLSVNTSKLESTLQDNFTGVTNLLAGDGTTTGVMEQFNTYLLNETDITQGMYAQKKTANQSTMNNLDDQITRKTAALSREEATMKARFSAMELLISNLNSQSGYITTLNNLAGLTSSSSSSSSSKTA